MFNNWNWINSIDWCDSVLNLQLLHSSVWSLEFGVKLTFLKYFHCIMNNYVLTDYSYKLLHKNIIFFFNFLLFQIIVIVLMYDVCICICILLYENWFWLILFFFRNTITISNNNVFMQLRFVIMQWRFFRFVLFCFVLFLIDDK